MSIGDDIKFSVLDLLRNIGMSLVNTIFSTIDTLYDIANNINSLNLIQMLQNIENSPFTKIFNAFFVLSFIVLLLFSIWKITFRIIDADSEEQPLFELFKEIIKCGVLIFSVVLIFNTTIDIGSKLSSAIYNNFNTKESSLGDKMQGSYMTINEKCYKQSEGENVDKNNVDSLKDYLSTYTNLNDVKTMSDYEKKLRNNTLSSNDVVDSGAFLSRCDVYKTGKGKDGEDYIFNYNFLFGIVIGTMFLVSIGFAVLMLGKRQIELAFLMVISPLVIASSVGRREQRSALYQQLASLILQAGALMLLIGLTSTMFNAIQNSAQINQLDYFPKLVTQSVLFLGCALLLMTGSTSLNRFIGENISANDGKDMMTAMAGATGFFGGVASGMLGKVESAGKGISGTYGLGQMARNFYGVGQGKSISSNMDKFGFRMKDKAGSGISKIIKGSHLQESGNPFARAYGAILTQSGERQYNSASKKWDFAKDSINELYKVNLDKKKENFDKGKNSVKRGYGSLFRGR